MLGRRSVGFEDLPPHLAAAIVRQAFDAEGRRLLPWLRLSLVSKCVRKPHHHAASSQMIVIMHRLTCGSAIYANWPALNQKIFILRLRC